MKILLILIFAFFSIYAKSGIDNKIYRYQKDIYKKEKSIKGLNLKLEKIAKEIRKNQKELKEIEKRLAKLEEELKEKSIIYEKSKDKLQKILQNQKSLQKESEKLKEQLTLLIAKYFSLSLIAQNLDIKNQDDIINEEILKAIKESQKKRILNIKNLYIDTQNILNSQKKRIEILKKEIEELDRKKRELISLKKRKKESLKRLSKKKKEYKIALNALIKEQKTLRETLNRLKILSVDKRVDKAQDRVKVRNIGTSYQKVKTLRYRGKKTIPPLDKFVITKKYGRYVDPIYKIKIFNESIELKPLVKNAKVKSVLNGKVVLAKRTPHLNYVIIIKHQGGLYTIYAHIDKLAPTIKKGKKVRKGYVIGRVSRKLTFEVTKNRYHIDPLDLIKIRR